MLPLIEEFKQKLLKEYQHPSNMTNIVSTCFTFEDWLGSDRMDKVTLRDVERFKKYLFTEYITRNGKHYRASAAIYKLVGLKKYFAFLLNNKAISSDPTAGLDVPKKKTELPRYLPSEEEVWELINKVDASSPEGMRDKAVIALMSIVPLKNKEVMKFSVEQVDLANRCIYPKKGLKDPAISMPDPVFKILDQYLTKARYHLVKWLKSPTDLLFVSRWGKPFSGGTLNTIFRKYNGYSTQDRCIYPFLMRQATANHMRKKGMKIEDINTILGVKVDTARNYITLARNEIKADEERYVEKIPLLKEFKEKLLKDGLCPNIINNSLKAIIFFAKYLKSEDIKDIKASDIARCKNYIMNEYISFIGKPLREAAIIFRLDVLKQYFGFLHQRDYLKSDPARELEVPKARSHLQWYQPTKEDIEEFASRPDRYSYVGMRDYAIIRLWHSAPLKTREYKDICVEDVDLKKNTLYWPGTKESYLSLDEKTCKAIERYLAASRPIFAKSSKTPTNKLFLNEWGDPFNATSIFEVFYKYKGDKAMRPYASRHIKAIEMLRSGSTIAEVKKTLRLRSRKICDAYEMLVAEDTANFYKSDRFQKKVDLLKRKNKRKNKDTDNRHSVVKLP